MAVTKAAWWDTAAVRACSQKPHAASNSYTQHALPYLDSNKNKFNFAIAITFLLYSSFAFNIVIRVQIIQCDWSALVHFLYLTQPGPVSKMFGQPCLKADCQ